MNEEQIGMNKFSANCQVTVLTYDLIDNKDPQVNTEIKNLLKSNGHCDELDNCWHDEIPSALLREFNVADRYVTNESMPSTVLWKSDITPADAVKDFERILYTYNTNNGNKPRVKAKVVAFQTLEYAALIRK